MAGNVTIRMCSVNREYPDQFSCTPSFEAGVDGECLDSVLKVRNERPHEKKQQQSTYAKTKTKLKLRGELILNYVSHNVAKEINMRKLILNFVSHNVAKEINMCKLILNYAFMFPN